MKTSPEVEQRVQDLIRGLEKDPAINCPITFNWHGNSDLANAASMRVRVFAQMMRDERKGVSFKGLKGITFHHDYEQGLRDAVGNATGVPKPTREASGLSIGMMVVTAAGPELVLDESVALALAAYDEPGNAWAEQTIRHELCHVDDFIFKKQLLDLYPEQSTLTRFENNFYGPALTMWDEFYANRYSFGSWSEPRLFLDLLRDSVNDVRPQLITEIRRYRGHHRLDDLLAFAVPKMKFLAQCFGYAAGVLAAQHTTLLEEAPLEHALLKKYGMLDAWEQCYVTLLDLDARRPDWQSILELKALFPCCSALFASLGFEYRPHGTETWVSIPETSETDPRLAALAELRK
ncbi:hypothetical protein [Burkholderia seminalis]|uniref:Uncharacterized protein n=2 Tax=Burkholderia cepacia complex TaxID=87882 RepID=A0A8A8DFL5_9BURK|nr:hypothetical protein [Burkholderia seminalis]MBJ9592221.1 hypothetical protein [Burkholderia seminalis]QTO23905.1 hypothetical protein DT99_032235 [Burkholderia seminalis]